MMNHSPFAWSLVLGIAAAVANVLGGLLVVARRRWNETVLKHFIAVGSGFMLAATFLRMMPESFCLSKDMPERAAWLILAGYFLVHFCEHTLAPHFHFGEETHNEALVNPVVGIAALIGLTTHTFFDGVSIASGFLVSVPLGLLIFFAVALHKLPEGFTIASIALAAGRSKGVALLSSVVLAAATLLGVLVMNRLASLVSYALPLSTGVTLYVAASDLVPEVNKEHGIRMALFVFAGVALFYGTERILGLLGV